MDRKDAIENIKKNWPDSSFTMLREALETLIPELKESEDERIRKWIIRDIKQALDDNVYNDESIDSAKDALAWLAKQDEQKPILDFKAADWYVSKVDGKIHNIYQSVDKIEPKFKVKYAGREYNVLEVKNIGGVTYFGIEDEPNHIDYIHPDNCEIVSEQNHTDKVKPKFKVGDKTIGIISNIPYYITEVCNGHYQTDVGCIIMFNAQDNFKLVDQNHAWSEEDDIMVHDIDNALRCQIIYSKSKLDFMSSWIDSLKERVQPQIQWKPSDEQMKALDAVVADAKYKNDISTSGYEPYTHLYTLLQDLKRL